MYTILGPKKGTAQSEQKINRAKQAINCLTNENKSSTRNEPSSRKDTKYEQLPTRYKLHPPRQRRQRRPKGEMNEQQLMPFR